MKRWFFKLIAVSNGRQLLALLSLTVIVFGIGKFFDGDVLSWKDIIELFLSPSEFANKGSNIAISCFLGLFGFFIFSTLLVSVFTNIFDNITEAARSGKTRYHVKNHILILGAGHQLKVLLKSIKSEKQKQVIVVISEKELDLCDEYIYYKGSYDNKKDLCEARVLEAQSIYIIGEDEAGHDSRNIHCLTILKSIFKDSNKKTHCYLTLENFSTSEILFNLKTKPETNNLLIDIFNEREFMVEQLLVEKDFLPKISINENARSHVVIFGTNDIALTVAYTVAQISHYFNFKKTGLKTCVTFIGEDCKHWMDILKTSRPELFNLSRYTYISTNEIKKTYVPTSARGDFLDIEWNFIDTYDESELVKQYLVDIVKNKWEKLSICVCHQNPTEAIATTMHLPLTVYDNANIAIYWNESSDDIIQRLNETKKCGKIHVLGNFGNIKYVDAERVKRGQRTNFVYAHYMNPNILENEMEEIWYSLSESHKNSSIYCANAMILRQKQYDESIDFSDLCEIEHRRWMISVLLMGVNNHQDIMPYNKLPQSEQWKDLAFVKHANFIITGNKVPYES